MTAKGQPLGFGDLIELFCTLIVVVPPWRYVCSCPKNCPLERVTLTVGQFYPSQPAWRKLTVALLKQGHDEERRRAVGHGRDPHPLWSGGAF